MEGLKVLAASFNYMAETIKDRMQTITTQRNNLNVELTSLNDALIVIDQHGRIYDINPAAAKFFRLPLYDMRGLNMKEVIPYANLRAFIDTALQNSQVAETDLSLTGNDDAERVISVIGSPIVVTTEQIRGIVVVFYDITKISRLAERIRRDLVTNVSHEIRTPLTVIQGSAEALNDCGLLMGHEEQAFAENIALHSQRLTSLVNDLLLLSKIEQNPDEFAAEPRKLRPIINSALDTTGNAATKKQIEITMDCPTGLELNVNPLLLELALINLVDNAVKYSNNARPIHISVITDTNECRINVKDHGTGIADNHLARLFERFYRVDEARSRQTGGTGLGLAIVKHIVLVHKGRMEVQSFLNTGSTFTIILPLDKSG